MSGAGFDPGNATGSALGAVLVFSVASFVGFESAAIYSEECKDLKRTVARATFLGIGAVAAYLRSRPSEQGCWGALIARVIPASACW